MSLPLNFIYFFFRISVFLSHCSIGDFHNTHSFQFRLHLAVCKWKYRVELQLKLYNGRILSAEVGNGDGKTL
jgi:hypothetical protein